MKKLFPIFSVAAITGGAAWLILTGEPAHAGVPKPRPSGVTAPLPSISPVRTTKQVRSAPSLARPREVPAQRESVASAHEVVNEIPTPTVFPSRISDVPMTDWRREQFAALNPQDLELLDYKLGFLSDLRSCLSSEHPEVTGFEGEIEFFAHFKIESDDGRATGTSVDLLNSTASSELDTAFSDCANLAQQGRPFTSEHFAQGKTEFHWATAVKFPLERDNAYLFFVR